MNQDFMLSSAYLSLGQLLTQIASYPTIKSSPQLNELVSNAMFFHKQLEEEFQRVIDEKESLERELYEHIKDPRDLHSANQDIDRFRKYENMRDMKATQKEVYLAAKADGLDSVKIIKVLRHVFSLSLEEAKKIDNN